MTGFVVQGHTVVKNSHLCYDCVKFSNLMLIGLILLINWKPAFWNQYKFQQKHVANANSLLQDHKLYSKSKQFNSVVLSAEICGLIPETLVVIATTLCIYY